MRSAPLLSLLVLLLSTLLAGCQVIGIIYGLDEVGGPPDPAEPVVLVQDVQLEGTTLEACDVTIEGRVDADGQADTTWQADFVLDSGVTATSLAADDGSEVTHIVKVQATNTVTGEAYYRRVTLTLYE